MTGMKSFRAKTWRLVVKRVGRGTLTFATVYPFFLAGVIALAGKYMIPNEIT